MSQNVYLEGFIILTDIPLANYREFLTGKHFTLTCTSDAKCFVFFYNAFICQSTEKMQLYDYDLSVLKSKKHEYW